MKINLTHIGFVLSLVLAPSIAAGLENTSYKETARLYFEEIINHQ